VNNTYRFSVLTLCLTCLLLIITAPVHANWTDTYTPDSPVYFNTCFESYGYLHDITDNGFDVGVDRATSYSLSINLRDDAGYFADWIEVAYIDLPGAWWNDAIVEIDYSNIELDFSIAGIAALNSSGQLSVTITRLCGDFYLYESFLDVQGEENSTVPAPGTLLLISTAILGFVGLKWPLLRY